MKPRQDEFIDYSVIRYNAASNSFVDDHKFTSIECSLDIYLNGNTLTTSLCSPGDHEDLIVGILAQMGKIRTIDDISKLEIDEENFRAYVEIMPNSNYELRIPNYKLPTVRFNAADILACADKLLGQLAATHNVTNGVHSGVIFDGHDILVFREDIGRHNVFDKLYGWALRNKVDLTDKIIVFSGRCSSEMMMKIGRMGISAVAAKSVPTTLSINIAKKLGVTLIARMTPGSLCIYTNPERIINSEFGIRNAELGVTK